ncbi:unnamed protein product, partial [Ectocarpus sp. 12 AP-2014]
PPLAAASSFWRDRSALSSQSTELLGDDEDNVVAAAAGLPPRARPALPLLAATDVAAAAHPEPSRPAVGAGGSPQPLASTGCFFCFSCFCCPQPPSASSRARIGI